MTRVTRRRQIASIAAALLGCLAFVRGAAADPPDRVGRVSQVIGPVSFRPATLDEWGDAVTNYPLTSGDDLWTDRAARAEVQLGRATARLGADTSFGVLNLDDHFGQFRLTQGSVALTVDDLPGDDSFEVDTPNGAVSLVRPGFYRIDVSEAGDLSTVTVRRGEAEIAAGDGRPVVLRDNESVRLAGFDNPRVDFTGVRETDEWEDWCRWRDRTAEQGASARYVSPGTIGYSDLDDFGTWRSVDQYGPVWVPRVRTNWAPYREGRWVWTEPWGWTWVDDQPWGFAPSHYGRWVNMAGVWGWSPGTRLERAIYAPALVVFIDGPSGYNQPYRDSVAWLPLGPGDPYVPSYEASQNYVRAINVSSVRVSNAAGPISYVNRTVPGAVTAVERGTFVNARPVTAVARTLPVEEIRQARVVGTAPQITPTATSLVVRSRGRVDVPPAAVVQRRVVAKVAPPPLPVPFAARESAMKDHPGRPADPKTLGSLRAQNNPTAMPPVRVVGAPAQAVGQSRREPGTVAPAVQPPRANERPAGKEPAPASTEPSARPSTMRTSEPPERQEESRVTPVPRPMQPAAPPGPSRPAQAVPRPNPDEGRLAAQQAAERARLEQQHAAQQAQFEAQRAERERRAQDANARQQLQKQEEQQKRQLDDRQVREHQQLQQQQQAEKAKPPQAQKARPPQSPKPQPELQPKPKPQPEKKKPAGKGDSR